MFNDGDVFVVLRGVPKDPQPASTHSRTVDPPGPQEPGWVLPRLPESFQLKRCLLGGKGV